MNRRSFIKGLIALASAPAIGKYVNVFKTEGARKGIENVASQGVDFFNSVIKKVMDEGNLVNESDRVQTFKHPDRPDINVEVDLSSGSSSVYFDTDQGTKAGAEIVKDIEVGPGYTELLENEEVYKTGAGGEVYKDVDEQITGGITNLEEFLKRKKGFAAGGRVGFSGGGIFRGLKGIQLGKVQKDLIKKYKDQGMDFIEAVTKGTDEGTQIVNNKKLNFLKTKFDNTNVYSDDYVKLIDEEIRLNDPEMFKDIRQFELNGRPELAEDKRFIDMATRLKNINESYQVTGEIIASKDRDEWLSLLGDTNVPMMVVNSLDELIDDPHLVESGFWQTYEHPSEGTLRFSSPPFNFQRTPATIRALPPHLGEHSESILREIGYDDGILNAMLAAGELVVASE